MSLCAMTCDAGSTLSRAAGKDKVDPLAVESDESDDFETSMQGTQKAKALTQMRKSSAAMRQIPPTITPGRT